MKRAVQNSVFIQKVVLQNTVARYYNNHPLIHLPSCLDPGLDASGDIRECEPKYFCEPGSIDETGGVNECEPGAHCPIGTEVTARWEVSGMPHPGIVFGISRDFYFVSNETN